MKTLEEAAKTQGVTLTDKEVLNLHFSPIPNWYGCVTGFHCPRCDNVIKWEWEGTMPGITNPDALGLRPGAKPTITPNVTGAKLVEWGHRFIVLKCNTCETILYAENFD